MGAVSKVSVTVEKDDIYISAEFLKNKVPEIISSEDTSEYDTSNEDNEFTITVFSEGKGNVSPDTTIKVKKGESITLKFTPEKNYRLPFDISDNDNDLFFSKDWNGEYVLENIEEDHVIKIFFISESSVLTPSLEGDVSDKNDKTDHTTKEFTISFFIFIIIFASLFGIAAISYSGKDEKSKKRKR